MRLFDNEVDRNEVDSYLSSMMDSVHSEIQEKSLQYSFDFFNEEPLQSVDGQNYVWQISSDSTEEAGEKLMVDAENIRHRFSCFKEDGSKSEISGKNVESSYSGNEEKIDTESMFDTFSLKGCRGIEHNSANGGGQFNFPSGPSTFTKERTISNADTAIVIKTVD